MWSGIWAAIKAAAIGLGWMKQKSDENTGKALARAEDINATLLATEEIHNAHGDVDLRSRVHSKSQRTDE